MSRSFLFLSPLLLAVGILFSTGAAADTLLVNRMQSEQTSAAPRRGATMAQIEAQFGAPSKKGRTIGKPPITRWDYPAFSVYFEYKHVIDAVATKATSTEMGAKPVAQPNR